MCIFFGRLLFDLPLAWLRIDPPNPILSNLLLLTQILFIELSLLTFVLATPLAAPLHLHLPPSVAPPLLHLQLTDALATAAPLNIVNIN